MPFGAQCTGACAQLRFARAIGRTCTRNDDHDFSTWWCIEVIRRECGDRSPAQLFELLGQFPRDHRSPLTRPGHDEFMQGIRDSCRRLVQNCHVPERRNFVHDGATVLPSSRKKSIKRKAIEFDAGHNQRREHCRCAWHWRKHDTSRHGGPDESSPRIGQKWSACVRHERQ